MSYLVQFVLIILCLLVATGIYFARNTEGFVDNSIMNDSKYTSQVKLLSDVYNPIASAKRPVTALLANGEMPDAEQCLVNFYSLGCRFTGYVGPFEEGYWSPDIAVQLAVNAGCRTFVLEIDYLDDCTGDTTKYFPRIVVRDVQGKLRINYKSNKPFCNSFAHSNIRDVCEKINFYAFSSSCQNASDPIIIVLYFIRQPPGSYKSKTVLDYYSNVAKGLSPFQNRFVQSEIYGGSFFRQKQEGRLLINKITDYNGKVLIFSNANTMGFRETQIYPSNEDLDFLTNLRLYYTQTQLGITANDDGVPFGILETAEDYTIIPSDRTDTVAEATKLRWTVCFSKDPSKSITPAVYKQITNSFGVHCVPILLFDTKGNNYMFKDNTFKTYSFIPKPEALRYVKPPIVVPGEPNPTTDAKGGMLRAPTVG
jgi:hypothetical protein